MRGESISFFFFLFRIWIVLGTSGLERFAPRSNNRCGTKPDASIHPRVKNSAKPNVSIHVSIHLRI